MRLRTSSCVVLLGALAACDNPTAPPGGATPPAEAFFSTTADGSHTLPITNQYDAYYESQLGSYALSTIIELQITGTVTMVRNTPSGTTSRIIDYRGTPIGYNCHSPVIVQWGGYKVGGTKCAADTLGNREYRAILKVINAGRVTRTDLFSAGQTTWRHSGSHTVSWRRMPAELKLTPSDASAAPGAPVKITASADPATIGGITTPLTMQTWTWRPDGGADTAVCGTNLACTVYPQASGTLTAAAIVNGEPRTQSVRISVPTLSCGDGVTAGSTVTCTVTIPPADHTIGQWRFAGDGVLVPGPVGGTSWSGKVVISGTVTLELDFKGARFTLAAPLTVNRRNWSWVGSVGGRQGYPGEIDACYPAYYYGATSGSSCTGADPAALFTPLRNSIETGFSVDFVPSGHPNPPRFFVGSTTITMQLRTQVAREYRADGDPHPLIGTNAQGLIDACTSRYGNADARTTHEANTICEIRPSFQAFIDDTWQHEDEHMTFGILAAEMPENDLHALLEPITAESELELRTRVSSLYDEVHTRILDTMHRSYPGGYLEYTFWRFTDGGWNLVTFQAEQ